MNVFRTALQNSFPIRASDSEPLFSSSMTCTSNKDAIGHLWVLSEQNVASMTEEEGFYLLLILFI